MGERVVREAANAKLNACLRVVGRRGDGFHEIETVIVPISLSDDMEARPSDDPAVDDLHVTGPFGRQLRGIPREEDLVVRALDAIQPRPTVSIRLVKRIPIAAGLGGGSADAAATLRAVDLLWNLGHGVEGLHGIAEKLGSDVPALLHGGPVLAAGRGERVRRVAAAPTWWVLVTQGFGVSAADAYRWWDEDGGEAGPDAAVLLGALEAGDPETIGPLLFNDLEGPVSARHHDIDEARMRLRAAGVIATVMCGSGPTMAGLARDESHARSIVDDVGGTVVSDRRSSHPTS